MLDRLCQKVSWPSDLMVPAGDHMEVREFSRVRTPFSIYFLNHRMGTPVNWVLTAVGRAYLAFCPDKERERILARLRKSDAPRKSSGARHQAVRTNSRRDPDKRIRERVIRLLPAAITGARSRTVWPALRCRCSIAAACMASSTSSGSRRRGRSTTCCAITSAICRQRPSRSSDRFAPRRGESVSPSQKSEVGVMRRRRQRAGDVGEDRTETTAATSSGHTSSWRARFLPRARRRDNPPPTDAPPPRDRQR